MHQLQPTPTETQPLRWIEVGFSILLIALLSNLSLYPQPTPENVLIALRITSLTTALPLLWVFMAQPMTLISRPWAQQIQEHYRELWLVLTASHFIHLYQIGVYYQLGQQCPLTIWLFTAPVWGIMAMFSAIAIARPQWFDQPPSLGDEMAAWPGSRICLVRVCRRIWVGGDCPTLAVLQYPCVSAFLVGRCPPLDC